MTLDELFDGDGLDQRLVELIEATLDGLKAEVVVAPTTPEDEEEEPTAYHIVVVLLYGNRSTREFPAGQIGLRWEKAEPKVVHFAVLRIDPPLRQARTSGALGGPLIGFLHDELGIEEAYAENENEAVHPVARICGFRDVERPDGSKRLGGRIDRGPMREHARWRQGKAPKPGWREDVVAGG